MRSKLKFLFFVPVLFLLASCFKKKERFPGFTESSTGYYYKLQVIGDGKSKPQKGQFLLLDLAFKTEKDSLFLDTKYQNVYGKIFYEFLEGSKSGSFEDELANMVEGDSLSLFVRADVLFEKYFKKDIPVFIHKDSFVRVEVKLDKLLTAGQYQAELKKMKELEEVRDVEEFKQIQKYISDNKLEAQVQEDGLFFIPVKEGFGPCPDTGMVVHVKMVGAFMNGKIFDNTFQNKVFDFKLGEEFQVVWGLQEGIKLMKEGSKAKLIIPSYLAFGEKGSSTGIVPPFTTIIYDVELIKVNQ